MHSHSAQFGRSASPGIIPPMLGCLLLFAAHPGQARAATAAAQRAVYVISDFEGYGVIDCITQRMECGQIVADSWCEAHGHGPALAYGRADDVTNSSARGRLPAPKAGAAIIACRD